MKFQEGDHVLYTGLCYGHTNIEGIVRVPIDGGAGVDFGANAPHTTHTLNGRIPTGTGWWCSGDLLQLLDTTEEVEIPTQNLDLIL